MKSLQEIYAQMNKADDALPPAASDEDVAAAKQLLEQIEARENEYVKAAAEFDAAGRIMARGFFIACHEAMIEAMSLDQKIAYYTDEMTRSVMRAYRNAKDEALAPLRRHIAALRRIHRATTLK